MTIVHIIYQPATQQLTMATAFYRLDAHQKPPEQLKALFKKYQKATKEDLENDPAIIDLRDAASRTSSTKLQRAGVILAAARWHALRLLSDKTELNYLDKVTTRASQCDAPIYQVQALPGLLEHFCVSEGRVSDCGGRSPSDSILAVSSFAD